MSIGILRTQLASLEKEADTLEALVLKELNELGLISKPSSIESLEATIQKKLRRLDDIQDDIDGIIAKLKAAGAYEPRSYADAKYIYKASKIQKPKPEPKVWKPRKVYPIESPTPDKLKAKERAVKQAAREARRAAREAARETEKQAKREARAAARQERASRPKPAPKPRKPRESQELKLAKKRKDSAERKLKALEAQIETERIKLERRLEERKARVIEVADAVELGPQKRYTAQKDLRNVQQQLAGLPIRHAEREQRLLELIEIAEQQIEQLMMEQAA